MSDTFKKKASKKTNPFKKDKNVNEKNRVLNGLEAQKVKMYKVLDDNVSEIKKTNGSINNLHILAAKFTIEDLKSLHASEKGDIETPTDLLKSRCTMLQEREKNIDNILQLENQIEIAKLELAQAKIKCLLEKLE